MRGESRLSDAVIKHAAKKETPYTISDGKGLFVLVQPNGSKYWRYRYRFAVKQKLWQYVYPEVGLAKAREKLDEARARLRDGIDPSAAKKAKRREERINAVNSFEAIAREFIKKSTRVGQIGYHSRMTGHGFRSLASTILNESGHFSSDAIERQLAHCERNKVRGAYNWAEKMPERRRMMAWYSNYLDALREADFIPPDRFALPEIAA